MKELSVKEKAKAYDNIIEKANKMHHENCEACQICIEELIPKLREEFEDERIRKNCIHFLELQKEHHAATFEIEECIAWLEKQGEQKKSYDTCDSSMMDNKKSPYGEKRDFGYFEEKPADKVEPKFHEGDWITIKQ